MSYEEMDGVLASAEEPSHLTKDMTMSSKVPPAFDGRTSWFSYEEAIDEWVTLTTLEGKLRGPNLRNMLKGDALTFKPLLNNEKLADPEHGVQHFKDTPSFR